MYGRAAHGSPGPSAVAVDGADRAAAAGGAPAATGGGLGFGPGAAIAGAALALKGRSRAADSIAVRVCLRSGDLTVTPPGEDEDRTVLGPCCGGPIGTSALVEAGRVPPSVGPATHINQYLTKEIIGPTFRPCFLYSAAGQR